MDRIYESQYLDISVLFPFPLFISVQPGQSQQISVKEIFELGSKLYMWCYVWNCGFASLLASCSQKAS